ncbi:hypothetical protein EDM59_05660 [Brevibacillus nitrificans]|uniref:Uncharacterized protein n=1 Tax=Brevibacillus nitrificans TaxID=651560 RepID=A0A3M8DM75_9BACL|nr:hypothetical protein EDM59_05660 [Brevibacillus nitrificans]
MDYTFENLTRDLSIGHEIEFIYSDRRFSITNTPAGWSLAEYYKNEIELFSSHQDLLQYGKIDGRTLHEIWSLVTVKSIF